MMCQLGTFRYKCSQEWGLVLFAFFAICTLDPKENVQVFVSKVSRCFTKIISLLPNIARMNELINELIMLIDVKRVRFHLVQMGTNVTALEKSPK